MYEYDVQEPLYLILKFMVPRTGVQALGWGQYGHKMKMYEILENILL